MAVTGDDVAVSINNKLSYVSKRSEQTQSVIVRM